MNKTSAARAIVVGLFFLALMLAGDFKAAPWPEITGPWPKVDVPWPEVAGIVATDFTADATCSGAWFIFSDQLQASAEEDRCGGTDDATQFGNPTYAGTTPVGTAAGQVSVVLDGTLDRFEVADGSNAFDTQNWTGGCWVLQDASRTEVIMRKNSTDLSMQIQANAKWRGYNSLDEEQSLTNITYAVWHHLAVRRSTITNTVELFHDAIPDCDSGVPSVCTPTADRVFDNNPLGLGDGQGGVVPLTGKIMECFYYQDALSDTQICEIALCGFDGTADGLARDAEYGSAGCGCDTIETCC